MLGVEEELSATISSQNTLGLLWVQQRAGWTLRPHGAYVLEGTLTLIPMVLHLPSLLARDQPRERSEINCPLLLGHFLRATKGLSQGEHEASRCRMTWKSQNLVVEVPDEKHPAGHVQNLELKQTCS